MMGIRMFGIVLLSSFSLMTLAKIKDVSNLPSEDESLLNTLAYVRPSLLRRQCPTRHTMGADVAMYACPSTNHDMTTFTCVRYEDLCNGIKDCPNSEDELVDFCMFHKLYEHQQAKVVRELKRIGDNLKDEIKALADEVDRLQTEPAEHY